MVAMKPRTAIVAGALLALTGFASGCTTIKEKRGYVVEEMLVQAVQPGLDNKKSVERTLGRPSFTSVYGDESWYYVSSTTARKPFRSAKIKEHAVLAVNFDKAGNVVAIERSGLDKVVKLDPDGDKTPTLGRDRSFFKDLFGNIGAVGAGGAGAGGGGAPGG
jgi:outer membrane protein assembly factor BamE (lipoprotein component of BamABCDE complex)